MDKDFSEVMFERTDKQLVDIVTLKRDEYQPEALAAAERELARRQINPNEYYSQDQIEVIKNSMLSDKANISFEWYHKLLTVLLLPITIVVLTLAFKVVNNELLQKAFGFPLIVLTYYAINRRLKDTGYGKMAKDFMKWVTYSLFIYIGLVLVTGLVALIYFYFIYDKGSA